jgi:hypothetical protein
MCARQRVGRRRKKEEGGGEEGGGGEEEESGLLPHGRRVVPGMVRKSGWRRFAAGAADFCA